MLALFVTICVATLIVGSPVPINSNIANIENYFGNMAKSLISQGEVNPTEKFLSADGHTLIAIQPAQTSTLQEIQFHPTNHRLIAENKTKLFSDATEEVDLIKIDLATASTTTEDREPDEKTTAVTTPPTTITTKAPENTKLHILKAIPTTIVEGTTESSTLADSSREVISGTTNIKSTKVGSNETTSVEIVTPENDVSGRNVTSTTIATSTTTESESESKEIRDKIKEVEAEPVILTVGV